MKDVQFTIWGPKRVNGEVRYGVAELRPLGLHNIGPRDGFGSRKLAHKLLLVVRELHRSGKLQRNPRAIRDAFEFTPPNYDEEFFKALRKLNDDSGALTLPYALLGIAGYMVYFMISHGVFAALTALQGVR